MHADQGDFMEDNNTDDNDVVLDKKLNKEIFVDVVPSHESFSLSVDTNAIADKKR